MASFSLKIQLAREKCSRKRLNIVIGNKLSNFIVSSVNSSIFNRCNKVYLFKSCIMCEQNALVLMSRLTVSNVKSNSIGMCFREIKSLIRTEIAVDISRYLDDDFRWHFLISFPFSL